VRGRTGRSDEARAVSRYPAALLRPSPSSRACASTLLRRCPPRCVELGDGF
jgi:hypothetical protein